MKSCEAGGERTIRSSREVKQEGRREGSPAKRQREGRNVSVLHQNEGGIGKSIPGAQEISRDLEGRGGGFHNNSRALVEYGHSIHHQGVHGIREGFKNPSHGYRP